MKKNQILLLAGLPTAMLAVQPARATEGGTSLYVLGTGGPGTAVMPPVEGLFADNTIYIYDGKAKANRDFIIGGNVVAGIEATVVANFATTLWVPSTDIGGGTLALGLTVPIGAPMIDVDAVLTGPGGGQVARSVRDSTLTVGDPVATVMMGWASGDLHIQASSMINIPVGHYREGQIANLALHRWAADTSLAASWHTAAGWDVSAKAGVTFNGRNRATDYDSGNEFHVEGAVEHSWTKTFSTGFQGYYFKQLSGDSGPGARLGPFKGEVAGFGVTAAWNVQLGKSPATFRVRAIKEFDATNRLEGKSLFLDLSVPLIMKMPK